MNIKSLVPKQVVLIFVALLFAACQLTRAIPTVVLPTATAAYTLTAAVTPTPLPTATATVTPSATPTPRPTATPTRTQPPTATATATLVPTPTPTLPPIVLKVADCDTADIQPGQRVLMEGYLALQAGTYRNNPTYPISLTAVVDDWVGSTDTVVAWITNGRGRNSMHFEENRPIIKDDTGQTIPWKGNLYITAQRVKVIGTFTEKYNDLYCHVEIEKVYYWSDPQALWGVLQDEAEVEHIFQIVKAQKEY